MVYPLDARDVCAGRRRERIRVSGRVAVTAAGVLALSGVVSACDSDASALPPSSSASPAVEAPAIPAVTEAPATKPTPTETQLAVPEYVKKSIVTEADYAAFEGWDQFDFKQKDAVCDALFEANGIPDIGNDAYEMATDAQRIADRVDAKIAVLWDINGDQTDARNQDIAMKALDCVVSTQKPEYDKMDSSQYTMEAILLGELTYDDPSAFSPGLSGYDYQEVTRYSGLFTTLSGWNTIIVEQKAKGPFDTAYMQRAFEELNGDYLLVAEIKGDGSEMVWGRAGQGNVTVLDPSRADAPAPLS